MTKTKDAGIVIASIDAERVDTSRFGEARKGVNILHTSDAQNPAKNPFVQDNGNGAGGQASTSTATVVNSQEQAKNSKK